MTPWMWLAFIFTAALAAMVLLALGIALVRSVRDPAPRKDRDRSGGEQ